MCSVAVVGGWRVGKNGAEVYGWDFKISSRCRQYLHLDLHLHWNSHGILDRGWIYPTVSSNARMLLGTRWVLRTRLELLGKGLTKSLCCLGTHILNSILKEHYNGKWHEREGSILFYELS